VSLPSEIQTNVARFLSEDHTPECFLRILQGLVRSASDYKDFRDALLQSFEDRQVRSLSALINESHRQRFAWLRDLESALEPWPVEADWTEFHERWESLLLCLTVIVKRYQEHLAQVTFSTGNIEPIWHEIGSFLQGYRLSSQLFLSFVAKLLVDRSNRPHPGSHHRYAKVVVTTAAKAHGTSWDYVILADAISDGWPVVPPSSPVLSDEEKSRLRQHGFVLLTSAERRQRGIETVANDLSTFAEEFLKPRITRFQNAPLPVRDRLGDDFSAVWTSRLDRIKPFDHYFLNFKLVDLPMRAWHPSELEAVIKTPATFAFRLMFNCRRQVDRGFVRSAPMTVGRVAHRMLQEAFGARGRIFQHAAPWSRVEARAALLNQLRFGFQKMRAAQSAQAPDLWWETILDKAISLASRMLENVSENFQADLWYQSEGTLSGAYHSAAGKLELEGRTDLILSDRDCLNDATLCICDFKTSKQPQNFNPETGDGLQFLGYRLLAKINGARHAEMFIVKPDGIKLLKIPPDEELAYWIESLARMQRGRTFGRRPDERWGASEKLPIATLPIDPDILKEKLALTL
jgi:hypothetical protein